MQIFTPYFINALRILELFEKSEGLVSVKEMKDSGTPRSYAVKILAKLTKLGAVKAKEGRGGGYRLIAKDVRLVLIDLFGQKSWTKAKNLLN